MPLPPSAVLLLDRDDAGRGLAGTLGIAALRRCRPVRGSLERSQMQSMHDQGDSQTRVLPSLTTRQAILVKGLDGPFKCANTHTGVQIAPTIQVAKPKRW